MGFYIVFWGHHMDGSGCFLCWVRLFRLYDALQIFFALLFRKFFHRISLTGPEIALKIPVSGLFDIVD